MSKIETININGLILTAPANKNEIFINAPKNAAIPVNIPMIKPTPTNTSPQATINEKKVAFGNTTFSENSAYQLGTSSIDAFSNVALIKPVNAVPDSAPTHISFVTLLIPDLSQVTPKYIQKIHQIVEVAQLEIIQHTQASTSIIT